MCDFFKDLFISIVGALIGIGGSFYIFRKTIIDNRVTDTEKEETQLKNRIRFLINLIGEVTEKTEQQITYFEEQGSSILDNPYQIHLPEFLANNQMDRLKSIDSQGLFEGYVLLFKQSEDTVKEYNFLLYQIDFLEKRLNQLYQANDDNVKDLASDFEEMRISVDELYSNFPDYYDLIGEKRYYKLMEDFNNYIGTGEVDVRLLHLNFLIPLFEEIKQMRVSDKMINKQTYMIASIRKITARIEHISSNNNNYATIHPFAIRKELEKCLEELVAIKDKIYQKL